jgi:hypothetical protein
VALAADPDILKRTGGCFRTATLAREYGFTEDDGSLPMENPSLTARMSFDEIPDYWKGVTRFPTS